MGESKIIVALDYPDKSSVLEFVDKVEPTSCKLKVGKELFTRLGPQFVGELVDRGFDVFLDLKFHDIPNTVKRACQAAADLGIWMLNVHALGGQAMLEASLEGRDKSTYSPYLIAVTVLTSMNNETLKEVGISLNATDEVLQLTELVDTSGLDGVVCSAQEARQLRDQHGRPFLLVTPGIRPHSSNEDDQKRVMTPEKAIAVGASYLVIGRPITQAVEPIAVLTAINSSLAK